MVKKSNQSQLTGPKALKGIRNPDLYSNQTTNIKVDPKIALAIDDNYNRAVTNSYNISHGRVGHEIWDMPGTFSYAPSTSDLGSSRFDKPIFNSNPDAVLNARSYNQGDLNKILAGVGKAGILAATTAAGILGVAYGFGLGLYNTFDGDDSTNFVRAMWDNPINRFLESINEASEGWLPNYYTKYEEETPFAFSANFWGDKVIKNTGFMIGAYYGGIPVANATSKAMNFLSKAYRAKQINKVLQVVHEANKLRKLGYTEEKLALESFKVGKLRDAIKLDLKSITNFKTKTLDNIRSRLMLNRHTTLLMGTITSAANEAAIEAISNTKDWVRLHEMEEQQRYLDTRRQIMELYGDTAEAQSLLQQEEEKHANILEKILEERAAMGNADFLLNLPILTLSNFILFGKLYARGFKKTSKALEREGFFSGLFKSKNPIGTMQDVLNGDAKSKKTFLKGLAKGLLKSPVAEGSEEYMQRAASDGSGNYSEERLKRFIESGKDYDATVKTNQYLVNFAKSMYDNLSSGSAWEEFTIGAVCSLLGMPAVGRALTKNAWLGKDKKIGMAGGIIGEIKDYMEDKHKEDELAAYLNERVKDPKFKALYSNLIARRAYDEDMKEAILRGDKKRFKDDEHDLLFHDIHAFAEAGLLQDFKDFVGYNRNYTDEELEAIYRDTAHTTTADAQRKNDELKLANLLKSLDAVAKYRAVYQQGALGLSSNASVLAENALVLEENERAIQAEMDAILKRLDENNYTDLLDGAFDEGGLALINSEDGKQRMREILSKNRDYLLSAIDNYSKIKDNIDMETEGRLDKDETATLMYLASKIEDTELRSFDIYDSLQPVMRLVVDLLDNQLFILEEGLENNTLSEEKKKAYQRLIEVLQSKRKFFKQLLEGGKGMDVKNSELLLAQLLNPMKAAMILSTILDPKNAIRYNDRVEAAEGISDLARLAADKEEYRKKLDEFLGNPDLILELFRDVNTHLDEEALKREATSILTKLRNVNDFGEFEKVLSESKNAQVAEEALRLLKEEGDTPQAKMANEYSEALRVFNDFSKVLEDRVPNVDILQSVASTLSDAWEATLGDSSGQTKSDVLVEKLNQAANEFLARGLREEHDIIKEVLDNLNYSRNTSVGGNRNSSRNPSNSGTSSSGGTGTGSSSGGGTSVRDRNSIFNSIVEELKNLTIDDITSRLDSNTPLFTDALLQEIQDFNDANPTDAIDADTILEAITKALEEQDNESQPIQQGSFEDDLKEGTSLGDELREKKRTHITNDKVTRYKIGETHRVPYDPLTPEEKAIQDFLIDTGAYDFVDNGYLGALMSSPPKIHYIMTNRAPGEVFLAIEYSDSMINTIRDSLFNHNRSADIGIKTVKGTDGKKYIVVGTLSTSSEAESSVQQGAQNLKVAVVEALKDEVSSLPASSGSDNTVAVYTDHTNKVAFVYTGRVDVADDVLDLADALAEDSNWKNGGDVVFGVIIDGNLSIAPGLDNVHPISSEYLNRNNGAVLMFVRKPDGQYYPMRCVRKTVGDWLSDNNLMLEDAISEVILGQDIPNSNSYIKKIVSLMLTLFSNTSLGNKIKAKQLLSKMLILGKSNPIQIDTDGNISYRLSNRAIFDLFDSDDIAKCVRDLFTVLAREGVMFTVPSTSWGLITKPRDVVTANVLSSRTNTTNNFNASFLVLPVDLNLDPVLPTNPSNPAPPRAPRKLRDIPVPILGKTYIYEEYEDGSCVVKLNDLDVTDTDEGRTAMAIIAINRGGGTLAFNSTADLTSHFSLDEPEFNWMQNIYVIRDNNGDIIYLYDNNTTVQNRLIPFHSQEAKNIFDRFRESHLKVYDRKLEESLRGSATAAPQPVTSKVIDNKGMPVENGEVRDIIFDGYRVRATIILDDLGNLFSYDLEDGRLIKVNDPDFAKVTNILAKEASAPISLPTVTLELKLGEGESWLSTKPGTLRNKLVSAISKCVRSWEDRIEILEKLRQLEEDGLLTLSSDSEDYKKLLQIFLIKKKSERNAALAEILDRSCNPPF